MNIWQHCLLSQRKFGGEPEDYEQVHSFMDSSKYFLYHAKHRLLLHHLFGVGLAVDLLGNFITNSENKKVLVRDISVEHCREDLDGKIPTLFDWLKESSELEYVMKEIKPSISDESLSKFIWEPYLQTGLYSSLVITFSDFGIYLAKIFLGIEKAKILASLIPVEFKVKNLLEKFTFTERWQYSPQQEELNWLREYENS